MTVRVAALDDRRAVGDGRIASLSGGGATTIGPGESVAFTRSPQRGEGYVVTAETVRPPIERLAGIDVPAAGLFQADAKREAERLGIVYAPVAAIREKIR